MIHEDPHDIRNNFLSRELENGKFNGMNCLYGHKHHNFNEQKEP